MNERLERLLDKMEKGLDAGVDFLGEQVPPYAEEILAWHFLAHTGSCVIMLLSACVLGRVAFKLMRPCLDELDKDWLDRSEPVIWGFIISCILTGCCLFISAWDGVQAAKAKIAPRVVIIDHIKEELK